MLNNKKVYYENFRSIDQMLQTLESREVNSVFQKLETLSSQRITNSDFSGVNNWNDAINVFQAGYKEPLEKLKKGVFQVGKNDTIQRPKTKNDFVGFVPHVPNTLMNLPLTMINKETRQKKQKMVHLTYSFCGDASVTKEQLISGGINFISLVNSLEKQGYRVKIDVIFFSVSGKEVTGFSINLKDYNQNLNLLKLAFPLVHPAMLRRMSFRFLETHPKLKEKSYLNGYGHPMTFDFNFRGDLETEWLKENKIIKNENSYYCNVYQAFKSKNIDQLAKNMGLSK